MKHWSVFAVVSSCALLPLGALAAGCGSSVAVNTFDDPGDASVSDVSASDGSVGSTDGAQGGSDTTASGGDTTEPNPGNDGGPKPDNDAGPPNPNKDTGTPATDTAIEGITLDNVCGQLAEVVCSNAQKSCCTAKGLTYKADACRTAVSAWCGGEVTQVKGGNGTFNASAYPACAGAWATLQAQCTIPLLDYVETYAPCHQLFLGTVAPGGTCTIDSDCKVAAGALGSCQNTQNGKRCSQTLVAKDGQPCDYEAPVLAICDYGLQCQFSGGPTGTCRPGRKIGESCNAFECGFGNYCNRPSSGGQGVCAAGLGAGATCSVDGVCASADCVSGKCTDPNVTVALPLFCTGTP